MCLCVCLSGTIQLHKVCVYVFSWHTIAVGQNVFVFWWHTIAIAQCRPVCLLASPRLQGSLMSRRRASLFPFFPFSLSAFSLSFLLTLILILHSSTFCILHSHCHLFFSCLLFLVVSFFLLSAMISSPEFAFTVRAWPGSMQVYL